MDKDIAEKLEKGYIHARVIIQIIGSPKEHVEESLKLYLQRIKDETNVEVLGETFSEVGKHDENYFGGHIEIEMLVKDLETFVGFCFDYMPSSIEVIEPVETKMTANKISNILNAFQGRLHQLDMMLKQLTAENNFMKTNSHKIIHNVISLILHKNKMDLQKISGLLGINKVELEIFLEHMVKEGVLKKEDNLYTLNVK